MAPPPLSKSGKGRKGKSSGKGKRAAGGNKPTPPVGPKSKGAPRRGKTTKAAAASTTATTTTNTGQTAAPSTLHTASSGAVSTTAAVVDDSKSTDDIRGGDGDGEAKLSKEPVKAGDDGIIKGPSSSSRPPSGRVLSRPASRAASAASRPSSSPGQRSRPGSSRSRPASSRRSRPTSSRAHGSRPSSRCSYHSHHSHGSKRSTPSRASSAVSARKDKQEQGEANEASEDSSTSQVYDIEPPGHTDDIPLTVTEGDDFAADSESEQEHADEGDITADEPVIPGSDDDDDNDDDEFSSRPVTPPSPGGASIHSDDSDAHDILVSQKVTFVHSLFAWGAGRHGQLGLGRTVTAKIPVRVNRFKAETVTQFSVCDSRNIALTDAGKVYEWGLVTHEVVTARSAAGLSGSNPDRTRYVRAEPTEVSLESLRPRAVTCGPDYSAFLTDTGRLYTWGSTADGRLGHGKVTALIVKQPTLVRAVDSMSIIRVAAGRRHMCVQTDQNTLYIWGHFIVTRWRPTKVQPFCDSEIVSLACGTTIMLVATANGECYTWGESTHGELGLGGPSNVRQFVDRPTLVSGLHGVHVEQVAAGLEYAAVRTSNGQVFVWGFVGEERVTTPVLVRGLPPVKSISCGVAHISAVTRDGHLYTWRVNFSTRVDAKADHKSFSPALVDTLEGKHVLEVQTGAAHTLALVSEDAADVPSSDIEGTQQRMHFTQHALVQREDTQDEDASRLDAPVQPPTLRGMLNTGGHRNTTGGWTEDAGQVHAQRPVLSSPEMKLLTARPVRPKNETWGGTLFTSTRGVSKLPPVVKKQAPPIHKKGPAKNFVNTQKLPWLQKATTKTDEFHPAFLQALETLPFDREASDIQVLCHVSRGLKTFAKMSRFMHAQIMRYATHLTYQPDEVVFEQGSRSDAWYVIFRGACNVLAKLSISSDDVSVVATLREGDNFGELGLIQGSGLRAATIKASQPTQLFKLDKEHYVLVMKIAHEMELQSKVQLLQKVDFFKDSTILLLSQLAPILHKRSYAEGEVILQKGAEADGLYFLRSGKCRVVKDFEFDVAHRGSRVPSYSSKAKDSARTVHTRHRRKVQVAIVEPGEYFGEVALIFNCPRTATVVAMEPCEALLLGKSDFMFRVHKEILRHMRQRIEERQRNEDLMQLYREQQSNMQWKAYKTALVSDIVDLHKYKRRPDFTHPVKR